jgi:hypothetical protein
VTDSDATERRLRGDSRAASVETAIEDVPGSPTWPIEAPGSSLPAPPPVGLNWATVSQRLGIDLRVLQHEGAIILAGEYFPESGFFFDPDTLAAQQVDVGDVALRNGYFLGNITARDFAAWYPPAPKRWPAAGVPVVHRARGAVIGLFSDRRAAERTKTAILQGAIGGGIRLEDGPLGTELRVDRPEQPGSVATVIASHGGAVISIGGGPVGVGRSQGPMTTAPAMPAAEADSRRPGTGSSSDNQAPAVELGGSEEYPRL